MIDPVVTGIGAITPLGHDVASTWEGLIAGRSGISPFTAFDAGELPVRIAGEIHGFDAEAVLGPKRARRSARFSQLAMPPRARRSPTRALAGPRRASR